MKGKKHTVGCDITVPLSVLKEKVMGWIDIYGEDAILSTDGGYNNVEVCIDTRKHIIKKFGNNWGI